MLQSLQLFFWYSLRYDEKLFFVMLPQHRNRLKIQTVDLMTSLTTKAVAEIIQRILNEKALTTEHTKNMLCVNIKTLHMFRDLCFEPDGEPPGLWPTHIPPHRK